MILKAIENTEVIKIKIEQEMVVKNCLYCGSNESSLWQENFDGQEWHIVLCKNCYSQGPHGESEKDAVDKWNKRIDRN